MKADRVAAIRTEGAAVVIRKRCTWGFPGRKGRVTKVFAGHRVRVMLEGDYAERELSIHYLDAAPAAKSDVHHSIPAIELRTMEGCTC